jgi:5-formaminoimidazole-4-carboxamide-1-beta-D-ribofuranosyl 5'-monophosphate synthetase
MRVLTSHDSLVVLGGAIPWGVNTMFQTNNKQKEHTQTMFETSRLQVPKRDHEQVMVLRSQGGHLVNCNVLRVSFVGSAIHRDNDNLVCI